VEGPFTGYPDFSPDGTKIVVSIFGDLWLLTLGNGGHTLASFSPPQALTRTVGDTEWQAAFSPDGNTLAYISGMNTGHYPGIPGKAGAFSVNMFKLNLGTLAVTQLLSSKDSHRYPQTPAWSPDGQSLAFAGEGERPPRGSSCGASNNDIFEIEADGAGNPTLLTNTVGTGLEFFSQWGW
jgi:Tol biopolymer transport system component